MSKLVRFSRGAGTGVPFSMLPSRDKLWLAVLLSLVWTGAPASAQTRVSGGQTQILTNIQTATAYTIQASDCGKLISITNVNPVVVTLPQAGTVIASGCWIEMQNTGAGIVTITPNVSTIDGSSNVQLTTGAGVQLVSSGGQYYTQRGQSGASSGGSGTVNTSQAAQLAYYPSAGSIVSGSGCTVGGSANADLTCATLSSSGLYQGEIDLYPAANSPTYIGLAAPSSVSSTYTMELPVATPANQMLMFGAPLNGVAYGSWVNAILLAGVGPVASIPIATSFTGEYYLATDSSDCVTGGGSANTLCRSTGTLWVPVGGGGGGSIPAGSDGQLFASDSTQGSSPLFEYSPFLPLPGITDSAWSAYGTINGTMTHTQITPGGRVLFQIAGSNAPEVHGRTIPVSASGNFSHIIATTVTEDSHNSNGMNAGAFFTDGTGYSACGLQSSGEPADIFTGSYAAASNSGASSYTLASVPTMPLGYSGTRYWQLNWTQATHTMSCLFSVDGYTWQPVWTDSTPFLTPSAIGYFVNPQYASATLGYQIVFGYR